MISQDDIDAFTENREVTMTENLPFWLRDFASTSDDEVLREYARKAADYIDDLESDLINAEAKANWWQEQAEALEATKVRLVNRACSYIDALASLEAQNERLRDAALALRDAQQAYMADRGNDDLGKQVGIRAAELDAVLDKQMTND